MADVQGKHLVDVGEMHFETVLCFVDVQGHFVEVGFGVQFLDGGGVDLEVPEGGCVGGALGEGTSGKVVVVGRAEEEDAFAVVV